jgi:hypothetical protein
MLAVGVAGMIAGGVLMPGRGGGALDFVGNARARWSGEIAIAAARDGNVDGALRALESTVRAEQSDEMSRMFATAGVTAVMFARERNVDGALRVLELAMRAEQSDEISRMLALVSKDVATEIEHHGMYEAAGNAWYLMAYFARHAGDRDLEQYAQDRGYAVAAVSANYNSAPKQVTVPSSLRTPSWHQ